MNLVARRRIGTKDITSAVVESVENSGTRPTGFECLEVLSIPEEDPEEAQNAMNRILAILLQSGPLTPAQLDNLGKLRGVRLINTN